MLLLGFVDEFFVVGSARAGRFLGENMGTGFERGLVFDGVSLRAVNDRPAAIDLSDIPDSEIGSIDLIRIRKDVSLRYDPATRELVLHKGP